MNERIRRKLEALYSDAKDGVCVTDAAGNILYSNPALERLLSLPPPDLPRRRLCEMLCDRLSPRGAGLRSRTCPILDGGTEQARARFDGLYGTSQRYKWSTDGELVAVEAPFLHADCLRLGTYGSAWDGLHVMRVERVGGV